MEREQKFRFMLLVLALVLALVACGGGNENESVPTPIPTAVVPDVSPDDTGEGGGSDTGGAAVDPTAVPEPSRATARLVGLCSISIWVTVAAAGRWIGFS